MASNKSSYESYPPDEFDNPPAGPIGVHRGKRSLISRLAPFIVVVVFAVVAGYIAWLAFTGDIDHLRFPWQHEEVVATSSTTAEKNEEKSKETQQNDTNEQTETTDSTDQSDQNSQTEQQSQESSEQQEATPAPTANKEASVRVINASGVNGYAAQQSGVLNQAGYTNVVAANPSGGALPSANVVWYANDADAATAQDIAQTLGIGNVEKVDGIGAQVVVVYIQAQ